MQKNLKRAGMMVALALAILYTIDYFWLMHKINKNLDPYGTVQVENYSAVPEKNNKVEFFYDDPDTEECVHSLFPHLGDNPCWIAGPSEVKRTDL